MTFEVFYAPEASDDIDRAFEWFAARAPAVAADFVRAIGKAEVHLERNPAIYRVVRDRVGRRTPRQHSAIPIPALLSHYRRDGHDHCLHPCQSLSQCTCPDYQPPHMISVHRNPP
jgi:plasmid stabilization system protein ParE